MVDPTAGIAMFLLAALVIGAVVFGGTTLAYFLDQRRPSPTTRAAVHPLARRPTAQSNHRADETRDRAA